MKVIIGRNALEELTRKGEVIASDVQPAGR